MATKYYSSQVPPSLAHSPPLFCIQSGRPQKKTHTARHQKKIRAADSMSPWHSGHFMHPTAQSMHMQQCPTYIQVNISPVISPEETVMSTARVPLIRHLPQGSAATVAGCSMQTQHSLDSWQTGHGAGMSFSFAAHERHMHMCPQGKAHTVASALGSRQMLHSKCRFVEGLLTVPQTKRSRG
jgi:hypothetical protein